MSEVFIARKVPQEVEDFIGKHCRYTKWEGAGEISRSELLKRLWDVKGLLINQEKIDRELLAAAPKLKIVSNISVGYNNFVLEDMKARKVLGTNTPNVLNDTVADLIFGLMLSTARRLCELDRYVKDGQWNKKVTPELFGVDVHHQTLGIIGMGRIGNALAQRAKFGFNMNILYHNRSRNPEAEERFAAHYCSLEELLRKADFVVLLTPLTPQTVNFMGSKEFSLMKGSAVFISASRGETVDEVALEDALREGRIRGAGLDVYKKEPVNPDHPLLQFKNVVTLPHLGSATTSTRFAMAMLAAENLVRGMKGEIPPHLVPELQPLK
ncbi:lactate dehydrogenase-like oxidoreductase [Desulfitobacterium dichloroeliminans LMG P-21439]|uniref:Glyoxylate/hydroxypyruvate reductase B n=1 Tax=Desulfitobacterium dichloroeliminans (strain LMG P-21439 / DCA1) TaxID=871963 RepID=L0F5T7_DESDL|nr:D-glycerate dehydrogenase [Desulfitobacterium dichloroeliminans]AGA68328.1 lactate dehydrogenase-like oxidoreductase [Desulfitobacterium dichloroeliminans LMG P-21439]